MEDITSVRTTKRVQEVIVESSARLHMGFFDLNGDLGRKFGSIGLSLTNPAIKLSVTLSEQLQVNLAPDLPASLQQRAILLCQTFIEKLQLNNNVSVDIQQFVMSHAGLGSGTQLALTIGAAISQLFDLQLTANDIAKLTGRGNRSGIGIAAFEHGGLLVDGGRAMSTSASDCVPPLLARYDFPPEWRVLLIFDNTAPGIHGSNEKIAFNTLPVFSEVLAAQLCRQVLMQAMPAIVEKNLPAFGASIQAIQAHTGDYFAPAQGGRYASQLVTQVLNWLAAEGVDCFGQSSWGPTGFAVFENAAIAAKFLQKLTQKFDDEQLSFLLTTGCNHGAKVTVR